jgi:hypothetical protein
MMFTCTNIALMARLYRQLTKNELTFTTLLIHIHSERFLQQAHTEFFDGELNIIVQDFYTLLIQCFSILTIVNC